MNKSNRKTEYERHQQPSEKTIWYLYTAETEATEYRQLFQSHLNHLKQKIRIRRMNKQKLRIFHIFCDILYY